MGIPLPALGIKTPETPDPMAQAGRLIALKNLIQANQEGQLNLQQKQIALNDQQAMTTALHQWDGQDLDNLPGLVLKNGGSAQAVLGLKTSLLKQKQDLANLDQTQLKNQADKNDFLLGHLNNINKVPDEDLIPSLKDAVAQSMKKGYLTPQESAQIENMYNLPPDQIRNQLSIFEKGLMGGKAQLAQEDKERQLAAEEMASQARKESAEKPTTASLAQKAAAGDQQAAAALKLAKTPNPTETDKAVSDYLSAHGLENTPSNRDKARADLVSRGVILHQQAGLPAIELEGATKTPAPADASGRHPEVLERLQPGMSAMIKALADGRMQFPGSFALKSPYWNKVLQLVGEYDPTFDATNYKTRASTRKDFTSGKAANNIRSLNTAIGHLNSLEEAAKGLNNGGFPLWNYIANKSLKETGDPRVVQFNNAANAVAGELATIFKNTSGTDQEIKAWRDQLSSSSSPAQINASLHQLIQLMGSRMNALNYQWKEGMGRARDFHLLSPESIQILNGIGAKNLVQEDEKPLLGEEEAPPPSKSQPTASKTTKQAAPTKSATMEDVRAFATARHISLNEAKNAFKKAGYSVNGQ